MSTFGRDLIDSAQEAQAFAEGHLGTARVVDVTLIDVAAIRRRLGLSQDKFARRFGLVPSTVRDWEQGRRRPDRTAVALLKVIDFAPETVELAIGTSEAR